MHFNFSSVYSIEVVDVIPLFDEAKTQLLYNQLVLTKSECIMHYRHCITDINVILSTREKMHRDTHVR